MMYVLREYAMEMRRTFETHPRMAVAGGLVAVAAILRVVWLCAWWILFAPVSLHGVTGRITCDGVPLAEGNVAFEPVGAAGVASRTTPVTSGSFSLGTMVGLVPNVEYIVRVEGFRKSGKTHPGAKAGEFSEEYEQFVLPAFNRDSESRVRMTSSILREGFTLDVRGAPASHRP